MQYYLRQFASVCLSLPSVCPQFASVCLSLRQFALSLRQFALSLRQFALSLRQFASVCPQFALSLPSVCVSLPSVCPQFALSLPHRSPLHSTVQECLNAGETIIILRSMPWRPQDPIHSCSDLPFTLLLPNTLRPLDPYTLRHMRPQDTIRP